ncbi:MAG: hypothetical protein K9N49_02125 [Candidatus Marinimicrobia bacterium]|nr:hypothetical protein [Candidatus Neomarinimicrobiota bacterium]
MELSRARIDDILARYRAFYAASRPGFMVRTTVSEAGWQLPARQSLKGIEWGDRASARRFAAAHLAFMRAYWAHLPESGNDWIPSISALLGTGAVAACLVRDARLNEEDNTNYLDPVIGDWPAGLERIGFDPDNPYYRTHVDVLRYWIEQWDGSFGLNPYSFFDPLDLANQLRGNDLFYDFYDRPDALRELLETLTDELLALARHLRSEVLAGYDIPGVCHTFWTPGEYLSCDAGDLSGPEVVTEWAVPYTGRLATALGGAYLHHHELGIHQILPWSRCPGISAQVLNRDPNTPHLAQVVSDEHLRSTFDLPLGFIVTADEFRKSADYWATGRCLLTVRCRDGVEAREIVDRVNQSYRV